MEEVSIELQNSGVSMEERENTLHDTIEEMIKDPITQEVMRDPVLLPPTDLVKKIVQKRCLDRQTMIKWIFEGVKNNLYPIKYPLTNDPVALNQQQAQLLVTHLIPNYSLQAICAAYQQEYPEALSEQDQLINEITAYIGQNQRQELQTLLGKKSMTIASFPFYQHQQFLDVWFRKLIQFRSSAIALQQKAEESEKLREQFVSIHQSMLIFELLLNSFSKEPQSVFAAWVKTKENFLYVMLSLFLLMKTHPSSLALEAIHTVLNKKILQLPVKIQEKLMQAYIGRDHSSGRTAISLLFKAQDPEAGALLKNYCMSLVQADSNNQEFLFGELDSLLQSEDEDVQRAQSNLDLLLTIVPDKTIFFKKTEEKENFFFSFCQGSIANSELFELLGKHFSPATLKKELAKKTSVYCAQGRHKFPSGYSSHFTLLCRAKGMQLGTLKKICVLLGNSWVKEQILTPLFLTYPQDLGGELKISILTLVFKFGTLAIFQEILEIVEDGIDRLEILKGAFNLKEPFIVEYEAKLKFDALCASVDPEKLKEFLRDAIDYYFSFGEAYKQSIDQFNWLKEMGGDALLKERALVMRDPTFLVYSPIEVFKDFFKVVGIPPLEFSALTDAVLEAMCISYHTKNAREKFLFLLEPLNEEARKNFWLKLSRQLYDERKENRLNNIRNGSNFFSDFQSSLRYIIPSLSGLPGIESAAEFVKQVACNPPSDLVVPSGLKQSCCYGRSLFKELINLLDNNEFERELQKNDLLREAVSTEVDPFSKLDALFTRIKKDEVVTAYQTVQQYVIERSVNLNTAKKIADSQLLKDLASKIITQFPDLEPAVDAVNSASFTAPASPQHLYFDSPVTAKGTKRQREENSALAVQDEDKGLEGEHEQLKEDHERLGM